MDPSIEEELEALWRGPYMAPETFDDPIYYLFIYGSTIPTNASNIISY